MTDPHATPAADLPEPPRELPPSATPARADPSPPVGDPARAYASRSALPVLCALGFLLLLAGGIWLWSEQQSTAQLLAEQAQRMDALAQQPAPPAIDPARLTALDARLKAVEQRTAALAEKPAPAPSPAPPPGVTAADLDKLEARIAALEGRKPPPPPDTAGVVAPLAQKLDGVAADAAAAKAAAAADATRLGDLDSRLKQAEQRQAVLADRASQAMLVVRAEAALAAGEPIGDIPNAPPALARFAQAKPPTEAALRLSFPAAADAAEGASRPGTEGKSLGERMWLRARALVTVKRGDTVLVGAPAATVLAQAHATLEAGDLAGCVAALDQLDGAAAQAMAGWKAQAQALLDARAVLAQMAHA